MIPRSTTRPATLVVAALLTLAACGSTASPAPTATAAAGSSAAISSATASFAPSIALPSAAGSTGGGSVDASALLSADMAASIIGGSPTAVAIPGMNVPGVGIAAYGTTTGDTVALFVEKVPGGIAAAELQAAIAMAGAQGNLTPISGVGEAAGKVVEANEATIAFIKNGSLVVISAHSGTTAGASLEPKLESVAQQVAGKL